MAEGVLARLATGPFETRQGDMPAGSILFAESRRAAIRRAGRDAVVSQSSRPRPPAGP